MRFVVQIISAHAVFATSVSDALAQDASLRRQVSVCAHYSSETSSPHPTAVFLLDLCCPGPHPNALCGLLRRKYPGSKFVCLISPDQAQDEYMLNLFFTGVEGIVCLKERWPAELRRAVRDVLNGQLYIPPGVLQRYARETNSLFEADTRLNRLLTAREVQVAHLALRQFSTRAIADELGISERTVKFHVANIFLKTGARSRRQLLGIVSLHKRKTDLAVPDHGGVPPRQAPSAAMNRRPLAACAGG